MGFGNKSYSFLNGVDEGVYVSKICYCFDRMKEFISAPPIILEKQSPDTQIVQASLSPFQTLQMFGAPQHAKWISNTSWQDTLHKNVKVMIVAL